MFTHPSRTLFRPLLASWLVALALPAFGRAADSGGKEAPPPPSFSDKTSEAIGKLGPLLTAKNYDGALSLLNSLLPTVENDSFDQAAIENYLGGIWIQDKNEPEKAIQPWERMLDIASRHPDYFPATDVTQRYYYLATIYLQMGTDAKAKPSEAAKRVDFEKSIADMKRFLHDTPKPTPEHLYFYATALYLRAIVDGQNIDKTYLAEAQKVAEAGLLSQIQPKENFYQLLIVAYTQQGDLEKAADYIELVIKKFPAHSKDWWPQLFGIYNNLAANNEKNDELYHKYLARDINTLERAQALGFMKEPSNNMNLVTMYEQAEQYGIATDLLYKGLHNKTIEETKTNWRNLALFYKLIGDDFGAIKVFKEADERFPDTGDFDLAIADVYYSDLNNTQEAYKYSKMAVEKGHLSSQPSSAYQYLAFQAYELGKYDEALAVANEGMKLHGATKELASLRDVLQKTVDNAKASKEQLQKSRQTSP